MSCPFLLCHQGAGLAPGHEGGERPQDVPMLYLDAYIGGHLPSVIAGQSMIDKGRRRHRSLKSNGGSKLKKVHYLMVAGPFEVLVVKLIAGCI